MHKAWKLPDLMASQGLHVYDGIDPSGFQKGGQQH
jgi:hypothetical protein